MCRLRQGPGLPGCGEALLRLHARNRSCKHSRCRRRCLPPLTSPRPSSLAPLLCQQGYSQYLNIAYYPDSCYSSVVSVQDEGRPRQGGAVCLDTLQLPLLR